MFIFFLSRNKVPQKYELCGKRLSHSYNKKIPSNYEELRKLQIYSIKR